MYGRSKKRNALGASGFDENKHPFDIDRRNDRDTPIPDYNDTSKLEPEQILPDYRSNRTTRGSRREQGVGKESPMYSTRIGSSRDFRNTSTPRHTELRGVSNKTENHEMDNRKKFNNGFAGQSGMDKLGRTMYKLQENPPSDRLDRTFQQSLDQHYPASYIEDDIEIVESPRSTQWPETARSYPVGFEAEHVAPPYINPSGESSDTGSFDRNKAENSYIETPTWAKLLLTKEFSLTEKFRNMRKAINKWSLRPFSEKARTPLPNKQKEDRLTVYDLFGNKINTDEFHGADSQQHLITTYKGKTNNLAAFLWGLFVMFIFVFPIIFIIVIFTDPPDLVQVNLSMNFTGSVGGAFDYSVFKEGLCKQLQSAVESFKGYYGCDVKDLRNDTLIAEARLLFELTDFPKIYGFNALIDEKCSNLQLQSLVYVNSSAVIVNYDFVRKRLIVHPSFNSSAFDN